MGTRALNTGFNEPTHDAVRELLRSMAGCRVLVVGDGMLDSYIHGSSSRISPEAPVQIVQVEREEHLLGGAANVAKCLVGLGARVTLCCVVGEDAEGDDFLKEAKNLNIDTSLVLRHAGSPTTVKTRIVSGRQHVLRLDRDGHGVYPEKLLKQIAAALPAAAAKVDAVLLSDYDKGVLSNAVCRAAIRGAAGRPVLADPKGHQWGKYKGVTVLKPNWREAQLFLSARDRAHPTLKVQPGNEKAQQIAHQLRNCLGAKNILLTRSERGMSLALASGESLSFPARASEAGDAAGAGDVLGAVTCLALAAGANLPLAAWLGNVAAGAKIAKLGTHTVSDYEILEALGETFPSSERKLVSAVQAARLAATFRNSAKKVVFTNGCFDILTLGHVSYLEKSRRLGDALIVGINTDASVKRLKGPDRPLQLEGDRARIIASQACVDAVVLFDDDTPLKLIQAIQPDVLCKGADYKRKQDVVGWDVVEAHGGRVELVELIEGRSTSRVIEKAKSKQRTAQRRRLA